MAMEASEVLASSMNAAAVPLHLPLDETTRSIATNQARVGMASSQSTIYTEILVKTAVAKVKNSQGMETMARVMFDEGSERKWIRKSLAEDLQLEGVTENILVTTFGERIGKPITSQKVEFHLANKESDSWTNIKALVVDEVGAPVNSVSITPGKWPHISGIKFADSYPRGKETVDILIGQEFELDFTTTEPKILGPKGTPGAVKTKLGWILCGPLQGVQSRNEARYMRIQVSNMDLNEMLKECFQFEGIGTLAKEENRLTTRDQ